MTHPFTQAINTLNANHKEYKYYSLTSLQQHYGFNVDRLPISIRIVLESLLRNYDGTKITEKHITDLVSWKANESRTNEIPFVVSRVVLQDFTGVPLLCDLAAMRSVAVDFDCDPKRIEPMVPVDLVVDHSVQVDYYGSDTALEKNMSLEFERNNERYQFLKWGMGAFKTFKVTPPGVGIIHQVNLEHLFRGLQIKNGVVYPDTLVGTDSHTTMINSVGVVGWGVGGIEAEASMLGQPVYFLTPDVVGFELNGRLANGATATDLVLYVTEILRKHKVVGKFVEFYGDGVSSLSVTDRATIANMAPEYGATIGFFPIDDNTIDFMRLTGRTNDEVSLFETYCKLQGIFGIPKSGSIDYSSNVRLDLSTVMPSVAGPKKPHERVLVSNLKPTFGRLVNASTDEGGFNIPTQDTNKSYGNDAINIKHGDVLIAAITSCTNTSNPGVLIAAGLLAKKAVKLGLKVNNKVKTSLAPGSRVVTEYLSKTGLQEYLDLLGFNTVGYGCTTCIGNSGPLTQEVNDILTNNNIVGCAVLSGNRNFEARIHPLIKANFLASPPLVVAYAIAGTMNIDLTCDHIGTGADGKPVFLSDIWPSSSEIEELLPYAQNAQVFEQMYANLSTPMWENIKSHDGLVYSWPLSTYIAKPPFFEDFTLECQNNITNVMNAKALLVLGDFVTTDHISPAGSFKATTPAGHYLTEHGVASKDFNSYGARRGHHEVMMRGTFANVRLKNLMLPLNQEGNRVEGGYTLYDGNVTDVYTAAMQYKQNSVPTIIFAGAEYGSGSSRDWAAKGTKLLGVKAVIASSYERIHRSNLVGMGILPLQFKEGDSVMSLNITGLETYDILGIDADNLRPLQDLTLIIKYQDQSSKKVSVLCRIDTPIEVEYYKHGGILQYVLRDLLA